MRSVELRLFDNCGCLCSYILGCQNVSVGWYLLHVDMWEIYVHLADGNEVGKGVVGKGVGGKGGKGV